MLCEITIENVAVIEKATAVFAPGFNVLSGETGAGKSILIDAVNAILGNRTSRDLVRTGAERAKIRACFRELDAATVKRLENAGYEPQQELLLYREISADGKNKCRINGMPATTAALREICADLLVIHGQHDSQSLMNPVHHLGLLDTFAQNAQIHARYYGVYRELCAVKKQADALSMDEQERQKRVDLLRFQIDELQMAALEADEEEQLTEKRNQMIYAQKIQQQLAAAYQALHGDEMGQMRGGAELAGEAAALIEQAAGYAKQLSALSERVSEAHYLLKESALEAAQLLEDFEFDEKALDEVEQRLDCIYRLKQKYRCTVPQLTVYLSNAQRELQVIEQGEQQLDKLYERQNELYDKAKQLAQELTQSRLKAFEHFEKELTRALAFLNMPGIRFVLKHECGPLASVGQDKVEFFISTNSGEQPKPLARIASGGELSRIMLAIKSTLADRDRLSTVIYDEIDTGVSGLAAARIGEKLYQTAKGRQVICITHTAQIAARADHHLLIQKNSSSERTFTEIQILHEQQRVQELARMISGDRITELALANAREMMQLAHLSK